MEPLAECEGERGELPIVSGEGTRTTLSGAQLTVDALMVGFTSSARCDGEMTGDEMRAGDLNSVMRAVTSISKAAVASRSCDRRDSTKATSELMGCRTMCQIRKEKEKPQRAWEFTLALAASSLGWAIISLFSAKSYRAQSQLSSHLEIEAGRRTSLGLGVGGEGGAESVGLFACSLPMMRLPRLLSKVLRR